jgi:hypothetical protein
MIRRTAWAFDGWDPPYTDEMPDFRDVDPRDLRVPPSRPQGADPAKLQRQIALFGRSAGGMPPPWVYEGTDGILMLYNGVTRATRIAKLAPVALSSASR